MKKWLAMLLSIVLAVQLVVPAWAADGGAEQPETVSGGYTETDPAETPTPEPTEEPAAEPTSEPTSEPTPEPTAEPVEEPAAEDEIALLEATVVASGKCGDNLTWELYENGTLAIKGTGTMYDFTGSDSDAAPWYSHRDEIKAVDIEDGVTSIGSYAFCYSALAEITIPDGVTSIGNGAFYFCSALAAITIPDGVTSIGRYAFKNCSTLADVAIPGSVTSIGKFAFSGCYFTSFTIPSGVTIIEEETFGNCRQLKSITIPDGVTEIEANAFRACYALESVTIPEGVTSIGYEAFYECRSLTSITIPKNVTSIGRGAFYGCTGLSSITIPSGVTSLEDYTFSGCTGLKNVTIPESVTRIGASTFSGCSNLTDVTIPKSVTSIGAYAFDRCYALKDVYYSGTLQDWNNITKEDDYFLSSPLWKATKHYSPMDSGTCGADLTWTLYEDGVLTISGTGKMSDYPADTGAPWFGWRDQITSVVIKSGATSIGSRAFCQCNKLTSVTIPDGVASIGDFAFSPCSSLASITIPDSVTTIGKMAFNGCKSLADDNGFVIVRNVLYDYYGAGGAAVTIPSGVTRIDNSAFFNDTITGVTIPDSVTSIGNAAFYDCSSLTTATIPDSVTSIGNKAFSGCSNLTSVKIPASMTSIEDETFRGCSSLTSVEIPASVTSVGKSAFYGCASLKDVYYTSCSEAGWKNITVGAQNDPFQNATVHYLEHQWDEGKVTTEPTCTEDGVKTYTCSICSETKTETITAIGHKWDDGEITTPATCTENGVKTFTCSVCKETKTETIPAPTPVASGICGSTDNEGGESSVTWSLFEDGILIISGTGAMADWEYSEPAPWSDYRPEIKTVVINPGITVIGRCAFDRCTNLTNVTIPDSVTCIKFWAFHACGFTDITIPEGVERIESAFYECWALTNIVIPKSATSVAGIAFECCSSLESITVAEGNPVYHSDGNCLILTADKTLIAGCKNSVIPADGSVTMIDASAFSGHSGLINITIPNTVTSIGGMAFMACSGLETILVAEGNPVYHSDGNCIIKTADKTLVVGCKNSAIPADGSVTSIGSCAFFACSSLTSITIPEAVTSISSGAFGACTSLTDVYYSSCSEAKWNSITVGDQNDPFQNATVHYLEHQWDNGKVTTPATCTEDGVKTYTCSVCKETKTETIEKLGHAFGEVEVIKAPTCTETGISGKRCQHENCKVIDSETVIPAPGHQWDDGKVTTEPTCTENGVKTFTCSVCKETKTETIEKLGHAFGAVEVIKAPTCTETGISGKRCQHENCEVIDSETVIPATGHQWNDGEITTPATCTEDGVKTYTCSVCKETRTETVEKLGHAFGAVEVIKAPTCTETGISGKRCQHEGCKVIDSETVIPAAGHQWDNGKVTTEPTCTEDGVKTYTCSVCSETKTEEIKATGHQWDEGVVTREPTYTENGEKTFTCAVCRATRTETIPMLTPEPDSVDLNEIAKNFDGSSIGMDVDGKTVYPDGEGNYPRLTVPEGTTMLISVSTYNLPEGVDPHTRYPVSMAVYKATNTDGTTSIERISEMDDLLRYAGSSIRITGNKGIRLITGIDASLKNALTSEGVAGYTLEEYGTLLCWASEVQNGSLSLSDGYARHNYAYSLANGTDPVFRYAGDVVQYTNVLVGFSNEQCVDDIAMRPYITLRDADGNTYTLYGGIVNRSIGYIAYQNRGAFTPGTNAYNYIWDIIHFVYGDAYDEDYKG